MENLIKERPSIFMLSGQGAQYYFMGQGLFNHQSIFRKWMLELNALIKDICGHSIIDIVYDPSRKKCEVFDRCLYTNFAIFIVEYSMAKTLIECGVYPDYLLGSSLGEFVACALSNVLSLEDSLRLLVEFSELLESKCSKGGMLAILGDSALYDEVSVINENSELVSISFHSHFVVSGRNEDLRKIVALLKEKNILYQVLPVCYAFHSKYLDPISFAFADHMRDLNYMKPNIPIISCCSADVITKINEVHLWNAIRQPIMFQKTIQNIEEKNKFIGRDLIYIDVGPAGTLATFTKYITFEISRPDIFSILTPFGNDSTNFQKIVKEVPSLKYKNLM